MIQRSLNSMSTMNIFALLLFLTLSASSIEAQQPDLLPSWNEGASKSAIIQFVQDVTEKGSVNYVIPEERIATFDNDGTLWSSHPMYFQLFFVVDRVHELLPKHPEWKNTQPFKAVLENDIKSLGEIGEKGVAKLIMATHAGMTTEEFEQIVKKWISTAKHPRFKRPFTDLVFQPMLELLVYLRANGFKTFIVSGGGIEFMRPWTEKVYGVPPEQVVGSSIKTKYEVRNGKPVLVRLAEMNFLDDKEGKPVAINSHIGLRPILAFGNSDGDLQMLEWTAAGEGKRFMGLVHHTDAVREYAYDRHTPFGRLDKALDVANKRSWTVVNMKNDWKVIYPFELPASKLQSPQESDSSFQEQDKRRRAKPKY